MNIQLSLNYTAMTRAVKVFQFIQKVYKTMGIDLPPAANQHRSISSINWRKLCFSIALIQMLVLSLAYLVIEAESVLEIGKCFYAISTEICSTIYFFINMYKMPKILQLFGKFERFIEKSTLKSFKIFVSNSKMSFLVLYMYISNFFLFDKFQLLYIYIVTANGSLNNI